MLIPKPVRDPQTQKCKIEGPAVVIFGAILAICGILIMATTFFEFIDVYGDYFLYPRFFSFEILIRAIFPTLVRFLGVGLAMAIAGFILINRQSARSLLFIVLVSSIFLLLHSTYIYFSLMYGYEGMPSYPRFLFSSYFLGWRGWLFRTAPLVLSIFGLIIVPKVPKSTYAYPYAAVPGGFAPQAPQQASNPFAAQPYPPAQAPYAAPVPQPQVAEPSILNPQNPSPFAAQAQAPQVPAQGQPTSAFTSPEAAPAPQDTQQQNNGN